MLTSPEEMTLFKHSRAQARIAINAHIFWLCWDPRAVRMMLSSFMSSSTHCMRKLDLFPASTDCIRGIDVLSDLSDTTLTASWLWNSCGMLQSMQSIVSMWSFLSLSVYKPHSTLASVRLLTRNIEAFPVNLFPFLSRIGCFSKTYLQLGAYSRSTLNSSLSCFVSCVINASKRFDPTRFCPAQRLAIKIDYPQPLLVLIHECLFSHRWVWLQERRHSYIMLLLNYQCLFSDRWVW